MGVRNQEKGLFGLASVHCHSRSARDAGTDRIPQSSESDVDDEVNTYIGPSRSIHFFSRLVDM